MKSVVQIPKFKGAGIKLIFSALAILPLFGLPPTAFSSEKWHGVDESVIERYAKEHGREARDPFINTDQGDLLLFLFLLAGAVGGFIGGYYWKTLTEKRAEPHG